MADSAKKSELKSLPRFKKSNGERVPDVVEYVRKWLDAHPVSEVHVGCDSNLIGGRIKYSTVICLREIGKGVHEIHRNDYETGYGDNAHRLWKEVERALEAAGKLREFGQVTVHVDLNSNPRYPSHRLYHASIGLIKGMGFYALGKPDAWAATCGANRHCQ